MSVILLKLFANTFRKNFPRHPIQTASLFRISTVMDVATEEKVDSVKEDYDIINNKDLTRFRKRYKKRQWEETLKSDNDGDNVAKDGETDEKKVCERIKRKKVALLLGYSGVDYYGMQRNPGVRTIEEDLFKALWDAKYITEDDYKNQQNAQFQRSSRTDKGVSAARQVVSIKLPLEVNIEEINERLPQCIRVFGMKRVTNKFNSKSKCNARTYSYTLPTYVFEPSLVEVEERKQYRIPEEKLEKVRNVLNYYKGTKCYHNFTEKKHFHDPSASRYMMGFTVEKVFVESDMEFAVLLVKGQSFMLHQIRKMVGLMIAVVRGHAEQSVLERAFTKEKVMIPTAPGLGLVLDMVHYDRYDAKYKVSHESLTWEAEEEAVQKFKHQYIYPIIVKGEIENNAIGLWLEKLKLHSYEPSDETVKNEKGMDDERGDDDDEDDKVVEQEAVEHNREDDGVSGKEMCVEQEAVEHNKEDDGVNGKEMCDKDNVNEKCENKV